MPMGQPANATIDAPAATAPSNRRKFIDGEPMKSATNIVAGLS